MSAARSLRAQLATGAAIVALVVVALAGLGIVFEIDRQDRQDIDTTLEARAGRVSVDIDKMLQHVTPGEVSSDPDDYGDLLGGSSSLVRLIVDGRLVAERGEIPDVEPPVPTADGYSTIELDGGPWRSLTQTVDANGTRLQVLQGLAPVEQRFARNALIVGVLALLAMGLGAVGGAVLARVVLRPLQTLQLAAHRIRVEHDLDSRLPRSDSSREVADLSDTLNDMLERLGSSMASARRFTADAGHELRTPLTSIGALVETLRREPGPSPADRKRLLAELDREYGRVVSLLEGLQTLARGDAGVLPAPEVVDVGAVIGEAVRWARIRHPSVTFTWSDTAAEAVELRGWREGVRLAVDNLLENAAAHGDPAGEVVVRLDADGRDALAAITVADDGPGLPAAEHEAVLGRFVRGASPRSEGSGLGLALVAQQAELHGGTVRLSSAPSGGLIATMTLRLTES